MGEAKMTDPTPETRPTEVERRSDRELVITRTFDAPAHLVFKAWTTPELFMRWWVPKSFGMTVISYEADFRTGGKYRLVFGHPAFDEPMAFFGTYVEVTPNSRLVWTNEESEDGSTTTVTLTEEGNQTHLVVSDLFPSKDALDAAIASGSQGAYPEQFAALDAVLDQLVKEAQD